MSTPSDPAAAGGHRRARESRALRTTLSAIVARGFSTAASMISVPLALTLLGQDRYGLYVALTTFVAWGSIADLGLGNGLTTALATMHGNGDDSGAARAVTSAFVMITRITAFMTLACVVALLVVPWRTVLAVPEGLDDVEVTPSIVVCMSVLVLGVWLGPLERIYTGFQEGFLANQFQIAGSALSLLALGATWWLGLGMGWVVAALALAPMVPRAASVVFMVGVRRPQLMPRREHYDPTVARSLLSTGVAFLLPQLASLAMWSTDNAIVLHVSGASAVATYATVFRLPLLFYSVVTMWVSPLWPAYAEARARGDGEWIMQTHRRTLQRSMGLAAAGALVFAATGGWVVRTWTLHRIDPALSLLLADGAWMLVITWCTVHAVALNALERVRGQAYYGMAAAVVNVALSIYLGRRFGIVGVSWATTVACIVPSVLCWWELRHAFRGLPSDPVAATSRAERG